MREYEKVYKPEDIEKVNSEVEGLLMKVSSLKDTMTNSQPWSVH